MNRPDSHLYIPANDKEIFGQEKRGTWVLGVLPPGVVPLKCKYTYRVKEEKGVFTKVKARLVVCGNFQKRFVNYDETFSPTPRMAELRIILQLTVSFDWVTPNQLDVVMAFLSDNLKIDPDLEIWMNQPQGYEKFGPKGEKLHCRLLLPLYGLKQAGREYFKFFTSIMLKLGFRRMEKSHCMFISGTDPGDPKFLIVIAHVDDIIVGGPSLDVRADFVSRLGELLEIEEKGPLSYYLGMEFTRDADSGAITVTQKTYLEKFLKAAGMSNAKSAASPMEPNLKLSREMAENVSFEEEENIRRFGYRPKLGSVLYLLNTRFDIYAQVCILARFANHQSTEAVCAMQHLLRYLAGTQDYGVTFHKTNGKLELYCYSDADFAGDYSSGIAGKSTTGFVCYLGGKGQTGPISAKSILQSTTATSTQHAEYIALFTAVKEVMYLRDVLKEIGLDLSKTIIFEDNEACIVLARNPVHHERTKHYEVKLHYTREMLDAGYILIHYIDTKENVADLLTKPVTPQVLKHLLERLLGPNPASLG